jgi:hypothetical protein
VNDHDRSRIEILHGIRYTQFKIWKQVYIEYVDKEHAEKACRKRIGVTLEVLLIIIINNTSRV